MTWAVITWCCRAWIGGISFPRSVSDVASFLLGAWARNIICSYLFHLIQTLIYEWRRERVHMGWGFFFLIYFPCTKRLLGVWERELGNGSLGGDYCMNDCINEWMGYLIAWKVG